MDWYTILKFLHVATAVTWVGGALVMVILGTRAARIGNDAEIVGIARQVA